MHKSATNSAVLPQTCIFCRRAKYKPGTKTREKLHSVQEFRADDTVRKSASLHLSRHTDMSAIAVDISGICAKDLISSEAKYHYSCYKAFVHIKCETDETASNSTETTANDHDKVYEAVYSFCEALISKPRVIKFKEVRNVLSGEADRLGMEITQSFYKNLLRLVSEKFEQLVLLNYQHDNVLVYPSMLKLETVVVENFELKRDAASQTSLDKDSETVINAAKIFNGKIKYHPYAMVCPPEEKDLGPDKVVDFIPKLLDTFCTILLSGQALDSDKSRSDRTVRLKNSLAQDIVYSVSNRSTTVRP